MRNSLLLNTVPVSYTSFMPDYFPLQYRQLQWYIWDTANLEILPPPSSCDGCTTRA